MASAGSPPDPVEQTCFCADISFIETPLSLICMLYFTTLPRRKSTIALISYLFGLFVYPFLKFVLGYHNAGADPQCGKTLGPCQLISPGTGDSQRRSHLRNREHQRQIFVRFECSFFHWISFLLSSRRRGFYLLYFVLLIYFPTIW